MSSTVLLEMKDINKSFASLQALDNASFSLNKGEVRALLGINGAGKSTLIKILSGVYSKDSGAILIEGAEERINNPQDAIKAGISTVYQDPQMISSFTGYENIYLGSENNDRMSFTPFSRKKLREKATELLKQYPLDIDLDKKMFELSAIEREIIAVLRALSKQCRILILDEPTSILTETEKKILFNVIKTLKQRGVSIIYITHHLDEVGEICDSFTVFRDGKNVAEVDVKDNGVDADFIAETMLGRKLDVFYPEKEEPKDDAQVIFEAKDISLNTKLQNVSFKLRKGEIYGVFGLVGSGIDELSKIAFGAMAKDAGEIIKNDKMLNLKSSATAIKNGIFLVPGDRKAEGHIGDLEIYKNITISKMDRVLNAVGLIKGREEKKYALDMVEDLSIATTDIFKKVQQLSGGNQQKVVISKGLFTKADIYIFCEPTVGVDVGAKANIYSIMRELTKEAAVMIISSDPEEVFGNADRISVIHKGRETLNAKASETDIKEMLVRALSAEKGGHHE